MFSNLFIKTNVYSKILPCGFCSDVKLLITKDRNSKKNTNDFPTCSNQSNTRVTLHVACSMCHVWRGAAVGTRWPCPTCWLVSGLAWGCCWLAVNKLLVQPIDAEIKGDKRGEGGWRQGEERKQDYQLTGPAGAPWRLRAAVQPQHEGREQHTRCFWSQTDRKSFTFSKSTPSVSSWEFV